MNKKGTSVRKDVPISLCRLNSAILSVAVYSSQKCQGLLYLWGSQHQGDSQLTHGTD